MSSRRLSKRRSSRFAAPRTHTAVELLEDKRLLSAVNADVRVKQTFAAGEDVVAPGYSMAIDRVAERPVDDAASFHALLEGRETELLHSRVDPALNAWREAVREKLTAEADEAYSDLYGQNTEPLWHYLIDDRPIRVPEFFLEEANVAADNARLSFSDTNVQVDGIDEADIVETDGEYLYILSRGELVVVRAISVSNDETAVVSRTQLAGFPSAMFLHNGRLTIIGTAHSHDFINPVSGFDVLQLPANSRTTISVFDVTNPEEPSLAQQTVVDGSYVNALAIGGDVYVVINNSRGVPYLPTLRVVFDRVNENGEDIHRYQTHDEFLQSLDGIIKTSSPPAIYRNALEGRLDRIGWMNESLPGGSIGDRNGSQTNILKFNITATEPGPVDNVSIPVASGWSTKIYASHGAVYLLTNEYQQIEFDGEFPILDQGETRTRILKVSIDNERMTLEASGVVRGTIDSQFSVDEHNGFLRVATTTDTSWTGDSENHLFVLKQVDDELNVIGSVEGLAPTETIFSARFDGDRAWMVTFRQVDPVFSFDLSDPANPRVSGELKIPGFSEYLQLIDENHLLAVGRGPAGDGSPDEPFIQNFQVSLFDISDMDAPALLHRYTFDSSGSGHSEALHDHRAFNYIPDRQILAVPFANPRDGDWAAGLMTLKVDPQTGISLLGDVDQPGSVRRSVRVEDFLYAISDATVSVVGLEDTDTVIETVDLVEQGEPDNDHDHLLEGYIRRIQDVFASRFTSALSGSDVIYVGIGERPDNWRAALENPEPNKQTYEFRFLNVDTGREFRRIRSDEPIALLHDPDAVNNGGEYTGPRTFQLQMRTRDAGLRNSVWNSWSSAQTITLDDDRPTRTSPDEMTSDDRMLTWTEIADRGDRIDTETQHLEPPHSTLLNANPVSGYEVWVSNAGSLKAVLHESNVPDTQLDISTLAAGAYSVWFRAIFADGSPGDWSAREEVVLLGEKPLFTSNVFFTADGSPAISWTAIDDADGFEIEVTNADGSEVVYRVDGVTETSHEIAGNLQPGRYNIRLRAQLNVGVNTEWSDNHSLTIAGRPTIDASGEDFIWSTTAGVKSFEVWVRNIATGETTFHRTDLQPSFTVDAIAPGQGADGGRTFQEFTPGRYHGWVRATYHDGSTSLWSSRSTLTVHGDAVEVNPIATFSAGESQTVSWQPATGATSYEVYVQKVGQPGAVHRVAGITRTSHTVDHELGPGAYKLWVKAALENGATTRWGFAHSFTVSDKPALTADGTELRWVAPSSAHRFELWINEMAPNGTPIRSRVVHQTDLTFRSFDGSTLPGGRYSAWVRSWRDAAEGIVESLWSDRVDFEVPALTVSATFEDDMDNLLRALDRF